MPEEFIKLHWGSAGNELLRIEAHLVEEHAEELRDYAKMYNLSDMKSLPGLMGWIIRRDLEIQYGSKWYSITGLLIRILVHMSTLAYRKNPQAYDLKFPAKRGQTPLQ